MSYYIGIDLGTTNSAICSYDGKETRIWKSPEQNDVTPSAISYDRVSSVSAPIRPLPRTPITRRCSLSV